MTDIGENRKKRDWNWRRMVLFGVPITGAVVFFAIGIIFWGGFNTAMEATNTLGFCISCHEMENNVYQEYKPTIHYQNRTGVRATCSDCHVPDPWVHKFVRKVKASGELYHKVIGSIDTREKFENRRLHLAKRVWTAMKETDSRECRNCHNFESMAPEFQRPRARKQHLNAFETGQTCIDCHKGIAHKNVRELLTEEELEALEKPNPAFVRQVPQSYLDSLARVEAREAEEAAKAEAEAKAARAAEQARLEAAVEAAREEERRIAAEAIADAKAGSETPGDSAGNDDSTSGADTPFGEGVGSAIDWSGVETKNVSLFYPGQASFEWVQTGKDHGGARAFLKGGDRCSNCHAKETADMGAKLVSGEKAEDTPIPGKRAAIDMGLQAAHDGKNLYLRMQWQHGTHNPVPFVDGGKMDPDNEIKITMMIAGSNIELADRAGCWVTCHHDSRYMPDAPDSETLTGAGDIANRIDISDGVTKYLAESRTEIEVAGRRGKVRGGWQNLKDEAEIKSLTDAGAIMDLVRYLSGKGAENGVVLAERKMGDGGVEVLGEGKLEGGMWTVVLSRPLASDKPGDISIEPGKTYTVGFAIHDDYTSARFHHVSLEYTLALDEPSADINVVAK